MRPRFRRMNAVLAAALLLVRPPITGSAPVDVSFVDPVTHLEWARLTDFPATDRATLLITCSPVCTGTLNGHDLTGWVLATNAHVETMVHNLLAANGLADPGPGVTRPSPDWYNAVQAAFAPNYGIGTTTIQLRGWLGYTFDGAGLIMIAVFVGGGGSEMYATYPRESDDLVCGVSSGCGAWLIRTSACVVTPSRRCWLPNKGQGCRLRRRRSPDPSSPTRGPGAPPPMRRCSTQGRSGACETRCCCVRRQEGATARCTLLTVPSSSGWC